MGDVYCLNCFHSYSIGNKLKKHEKGCNDHDYCYVKMPNDDNKILKWKSLKAPFIISADLECLLEKMHSCQNNLKNLIQKKTLSIRLLVFNIYKLFVWPNKKQTWFLQRWRLYGKFWQRLERACNENNELWKKEIIPLTDEENEFYEMQKVCYICKKIFSTDKNDKNVFKLYHKVRDHCDYTRKFRGAAIVFAV